MTHPVRLVLQQGFVEQLAAGHAYAALEVAVGRGVEIAARQVLAHIGPGPFEALARDEQAERQAHGARRASVAAPFGVKPCGAAAFEVQALAVTPFAAEVQTLVGEQQVAPPEGEVAAEQTAQR